MWGGHEAERFTQVMVARSGDRDGAPADGAEGQHVSAQQRLQILMRDEAPKM
jgi:hypothetical protein